MWTGIAGPTPRGQRPSKRTFQLCRVLSISYRELTKMSDQESDTSWVLESLFCKSEASSSGGEAAWGKEEWGGLCSVPFSPHPVRSPPETQPMCEGKGNICGTLGFRPWKVLSYPCGIVGDTEAQGRGHDALGHEGDGKLIGEESLITDPAYWLRGVLCAGGRQRHWVCGRCGVLHRKGECQV